MEVVVAQPKAKAKRILKEHKLEQPKAKAKAKATLKEHKLEQPEAKAILKEHKLEQPKAKAKIKATLKEPKQLILQSEKDELLREQLKLRQFKEAERVYNNAISQLYNPQKV